MECYAAGVNKNSQIGNTSLNSGRGLHQVTRIQLSFDNIVSIAAGCDHVVYILDNGSAFGVGSDEKFQIGIGQEQNYSMPVPIILSSDTYITAAAAGWFYTLYVTKEGDAIYCRNESKKKHVKVNIPAKALMPIKGMKTPALIDQNGDFYFLSTNPNDQPTRHHLCAPVYDLAIGKEFKLALTVDGVVWGTGSVKVNESYQPASNCDKNYKPVIDLSKVSVQRVFGYHECCAILTKDGSLRMFGDNYFGQLGTGDTQDNTTFQPVKGLENTPVARVDLGQSHTLILCEDGKAYSIGFNEDGQLLTNSKDNKCLTPQLIETVPDTITNIFCGDNFSIVGTHAPLVPSVGEVFFGLNGSLQPIVSRLYRFLDFP